MTESPPASVRGSRIRSLSSRLQALTISLIAISVLTISTLMMTEEIEEKLRDVQTGSMSAASTFAELAVFGVYTRNRDGLDEVARIAAMHSEYRYIEIFDAQGRRLLNKVFHGMPAPEVATILDAVSADAAYKPRLINPAGTVGILQGADLQVLAPVVSRPLQSPGTDPTTAGERPAIIGHVHIGVSLRDVLRSIYEDLAIGFGSGLLLIMLGALFTVFFTRRIVGPIEKLTAMAERVAAGDLETRVSIATGDELQTLGESFNRMSDSLRVSRRQIADYQSSLETMVKTRTEELRKTASHAQLLAQRDVLTGLANRALLNRQLHLAIAQAERRGDKVAVLSADLKDFGAFCDANGREAGDDLLQAVGSRLAACVRDGDTVARIDAHRFVLVICDIRAANVEHDLSRVIDTVAQALSRPCDLDGRKFGIDASLGVAIYPDDASSPRMLLAHAREATERSGALGGYRFYRSDMDERIARRSEIELGLRSAVAREQFDLGFEPVLDLHLGTITHVDASMVWNHPEQGPIACARVMPVAEDTGLHIPMSVWLLRHGCDAAVRMQGAALRKIIVSIRLTARQALQGGLIAMVGTAVSESGIDPAQLAIGIPESAVAADLGAALMQMRGLKGLGVRLTVVEYGTGSTNLADLARLPLDSVAIDRSFVRGLSASASDRAVVQAYIAMAHSLGLRLAADGVDETASLEFLREHGCDKAQGAVFGQPLTETEITRMLTEHPASNGPSLMRH